MLRESLDDLDANGVKGDWCFLNDDTLLCLRWGNEWDQHCILYVREVPGQKRPVWDWDGDKVMPTLHPSIRVSSMGKELWHGYLTAGVLEEA